MSATRSGYIHVYLLDDHDIVRQGLRDLLAPARDIYVVGDSGRARTAAESIIRLETQVMVLDLQLQDGNGVSVCRQVRAMAPSIKGLLLTSADDDDALAAAVLAGASGCLVKLTHSSDILRAIRALGAGETLIGDELAGRAANYVRRRAQAATPALTDEELDLLELVLAGQTDQEIADHLPRDLERTQQAVGELVERLMTAGPGRADTVGRETSGGKHRRT